MTDKSDGFKRIGTVLGSFDDAASTFRTGDSVTDEVLTLLEEEGFRISEVLMSHPFILVRMTADKNQETAVLIASHSYPATLETGQTINEPIIFRGSSNQKNSPDSVTARQYIQSRKPEQKDSPEMDGKRPKL